MSDAEKTFQIIKDIYMDDTVPKTKNDYENFRNLLKAVKYQIKVKLLTDILKTKGEETIKVLDDTVVMLETRLAELEAAPYGSDKSAAELIGEDFEENKRKYNAKIAAFKEIIEYVKRLREKAKDLDKEDPEKIKPLIEAIFYEDFSADAKFKDYLISTLAAGYYDFYPFNGQYILKSMKGPGRVVPTGHETDINFDYVDDVMGVLLNPEKREKYNHYFELLDKVDEDEKHLASNNDRLEYTKWFMAHETELEGLTAKHRSICEQIEKTDKQRVIAEQSNEIIRHALDKLKANKLTAFLNKRLIEENEAKLKEQVDRWKTLKNDLAALEEERANVKNELHQLVNELKGTVSDKALEAINEIITPRRIVYPANNKDMSVDMFRKYTGNIQELEGRQDELKANVSESKQKLNEAKMAMPQEMREEIDRNGWKLRYILGYREARERYGATPYISLAILKVLSDTTHLSPEDLFEQLGEAKTYGDFSAGVESKIERYLSDHTYIGEERAQKTVAAKFKTYQEVKDEPKIRAMVAAAKPEPEDYYDEQREFNYYRR